MSRTTEHRYQDPLDTIWTQTAQRLGLRIERGAQSYASCDGHGTLSISDPAGMDPDDSLAQMILHEICHSLVQGPQSFGWVDWGLDNMGAGDDEREQACLRLQAALLDPWGLRRILAPTTDFRAFYDQLPADPFEERKAEERASITMARAAYARRNRRPWRGHLSLALGATRRILEECAPFIPSQEASLLASLLEVPLALHPSGIPLLRAFKDGSCDDCAWSFAGGPGKKRLRCRQAENAPVKPDDPACLAHERPLDCLTCGACCREAYDTVEVGPRDPARKLHLELLVERKGGRDMGRKGSRCICLEGGIPHPPPRVSIFGGSGDQEDGDAVAPRTIPGGAPFTCTIYETRPKTCRDFTLGSQHCLDARRIVGLSR